MSNDQFKVKDHANIRFILSKKTGTEQDDPFLKKGNPDKVGFNGVRRPEDDLIPRKKTRNPYIWIDYDPATIGTTNVFTSNPVNYQMARINASMFATGYFNNGGEDSVDYQNSVAQIFKESVHKAPAAELGSIGYDLTDDNSVVGTTGVSGGAPSPGSPFLRAFINADPPFGTFHLLDHVADASSDHFGTQNVAFGICNHVPQIIVGASNQAVMGDSWDTDGSAAGQAVRWDGLVGSLLFPSDSGVFSAAYDVNNSGVIVGVRNQQPFVLDPIAGLVTLPTPGAGVGSLVWAKAINADGHIVGVHTPSAFDFFTGSWFYNGTTIVDITNPTPPVTFNPGSGDITVIARIEALDINIHDQVVGWYVSHLGPVGEETKHGFLWDPTHGLVDLNTLLQPGTDFNITIGTGINDHGDIAASGFHTGIIEGAGRPFLGKKQ